MDAAARDWLRGYFDHFAADPNGWRTVADAALAAAEATGDRTGQAALSQASRRHRTARLASQGCNDSGG